MAPDQTTTAYSMTVLTLLLCVVFPLYFVLLWMFISWLISVFGGWGRLAPFYRVATPPFGRGFIGQTGFVGRSRYRNSLDIHVAPEGLYLAVAPIFRMGHPPLLIPWRALGPTTPQRWRNIELLEAPVSAPAAFTSTPTAASIVTTVRLPAYILESDDVNRYRESAGTPRPT
jgi:hypothetical protein